MSKWSRPKFSHGTMPSIIEFLNGSLTSTLSHINSAKFPSKWCQIDPESYKRLLGFLPKKTPAAARPLGALGGPRSTGPSPYPCPWLRSHQSDWQIPPGIPWKTKSWSRLLIAEFNQPKEKFWDWIVSDSFWVNYNISLTWIVRP